jgi:hypothetical protein
MPHRWCSTLRRPYAGSPNPRASRLLAVTEIPSLEPYAASESILKTINRRVELRTRNLLLSVSNSQTRHGHFADSLLIVFALRIVNGCAAAKADFDSALNAGLNGLLHPVVVHTYPNPRNGNNLTPRTQNRACSPVTEPNNICSFHSSTHESYVCPRYLISARKGGR